VPFLIQSPHFENRVAQKLHSPVVLRKFDFSSTIEGMSWEDKFQNWAKPPSETEQERCDHAEQAIRKAIDASPALNHRKIKVFPQGSYRNHTNVRLDSDVDICVLCTDVYFCNYTMSEGLTDADVGLGEASYTYTQLKNDVEAALRSHFGSPAVTRGNKAFDIHENTYRVDADVVACFEHRRYSGRPENYSYISGTELRPDNGGIIINWPEQHYENGVAKNSATRRNFKSVVRILKRLRNEMEDDGIVTAQPIPSYLIECLTWNVPDDKFTHYTYTADIQACLAHLFNHTMSLDKCNEWGEINELKYLFRTSQPWTVEQTHKFLSDAWDYIGFQ